MPIFIVGFARSGTTLCQKLVSQDVGIPTLPETHYFEFLEDHEPAGGFVRPDAARELLRQLERFLQIDVAELKPLLSREEVPIRPLFLHLVGQQIGSQPLADKGLWIEKTPGHAEHLERIYQMFPKARFLCMVRDPVHAFASRRELQSTGRGWGEAWKPIEAFCAQWTEHVRNFRAFSARHPGQLLTIRLEDLAGNPNAELLRVREFLGPGFATPIESPRHPEIIQPFETWKRDALKPADASIADRSGRGLLDEYETWRVKTLLREPMSVFGYEVDAQEPPGLDDLHRRTVASLDWYVEQFARRDALMDVKTTRIRNLLNELAERNSAAASAAAPPRPLASTLQPNPLLVARVGALARNDATGPDDDPPSPPAKTVDDEDEPGGARGPSTSAAARAGRPSAQAGQRMKDARGVAPAGATTAGAPIGMADKPRPPGTNPGANTSATTRPGDASGGGAARGPGGATGGGGAVQRPGGATGGGATQGPGGATGGNATQAPGGAPGGGAAQGRGGMTGGGARPGLGGATGGGAGPGPGAASGGGAQRPGGAAGGGNGAAQRQGGGVGGGVGGAGSVGGGGGGSAGGGSGSGSGSGGSGGGASGGGGGPAQRQGAAAAMAPAGGAAARQGGAGGARAGGLGGGLARTGGPPAGAGQAGKPGMRAGLKAGGRGRPGGRAGAGQTHAQRQGRNYIVDEDGPLDDNLPNAWRPMTLHGISGVDDNGETFLAEAAEIVARRASQPAGRAGAEKGDDITDASDGS